MKKYTIVKYKFERDDAINLKVFCMQKNITLQEFAKKCGISYSYLGFIMTGKRPVTGPLMAKMRLAGFDYERK